MKFQLKNNKNGRKSTLYFCIFCIRDDDENELNSMKDHEAFFSSFSSCKRELFSLFKNRKLSKKKHRTIHRKKRWKCKFNCKIPLHDIKSGPAIIYDAVSFFPSLICHVVFFTILFVRAYRCNFFSARMWMQIIRIECSWIIRWICRISVCRL